MNSSAQDRTRRLIHRYHAFVELSDVDRPCIGFRPADDGDLVLYADHAAALHLAAEGFREIQEASDGLRRLAAEEQSKPSKRNKPNTRKWIISEVTLKAMCALLAALSVFVVGCGAAASNGYLVSTGLALGVGWLLFTILYVCPFYPSTPIQHDELWP